LKRLARRPAARERAYMAAARSEEAELRRGLGAR
jgi:hypothetical protein